MKAFIENITAITSVPTSFPEIAFTKINTFRPENGYHSVQDPVYAQYIGAGDLRRMPRLVKMGVYASSHCLKTMQLEHVDAITIGTGLGGFESFEKFEQSIVKNDESTLSPTPFIQSLHNTVSGQIALNLKCYGYNMTYVHRGFSFETALLDAQMLLEEQPEIRSVLVGGLDELTPNYVKMWQRGLHTEVVAGEGSTFMVLSSQPSDRTIAAVQGVRTLFQPDGWTDLAHTLSDWLTSEGKSLPDIDMVLMGHCGNETLDQTLTDLENQLFIDVPKVYFKNLCGEYYTSSAFAVWMATELLKQSILHPETAGKAAPQNILIVNQYQNTNYSLIWLSQS